MSWKKTSTWKDKKTKEGKKKSNNGKRENRSSASSSSRNEGMEKGTEHKERKNNHFSMGPEKQTLRSRSHAHTHARTEKDDGGGGGPVCEKRQQKPLVDGVSFSMRGTLVVMKSTALTPSQERERYSSFFLSLLHQDTHLHGTRIARAKEHEREREEEREITRERERGRKKGEKNARQVPKTARS